MFSKTNLVVGTVILILAFVGWLKGGGTDFLEFAKIAWVSYLILPLFCLFAKGVLNSK